MYKPLEDLEKYKDTAVANADTIGAVNELNNHQSYNRLHALLTKLEKLSEVDENILNGIIGSLESSGETYYSVYLQFILDIVKEIKEEL